MPDYFEDITIETEDIPSSRLRWPEANEEQIIFMRKVYDINFRWSSRNGTFIADIPTDQLDTIENEHEARTEAAAACRNLLAAARKKIQDESVNVTIGITSGYRSATRQLSLWQSYFPNYYSETATHRGSLDGGEHGDKAAAYLAGYIRPKVAIPGFSNHQNGIAVDLLNVENGKPVLNKTKSPHPAKWRESWLWDWLEANAISFGFYQNTNINEPWHWEYKGITTERDESYRYDFYEMETDESIPQLLERETSPAAETLYVKIDLGLRKERIYKYDNPKNDTASVHPMTGIFIPKNFVAAEEIDLLIYLHGHKSAALGKDRSINEYWNVKKFPHFAFRELVNDSGKNIILVAPTLGPRSQARTLTTNTGFANFIAKVIASIAEYAHQYKDLEAPVIKNIILACHSGGGNAMYKITQLSEKNNDAKKITACWGFDCTYGPDDADALHKWATGNTKDSPRNLFVYYRANSGTEKQGKDLKDNLPKLSNITIMELPNTADHNLIPSKFFPERLSGLNDAAESFHEEECGCEHEGFESDYTVENTVTFPSGQQLTITTGDEAQGDEYYDPNQSGNPLLDTSGSNKDIKLSANFTVKEFAKSGGKNFDKARIDPDLISCLQAIRDHAGKSVTISSGYRSYGYNQRLAKGSKNVATKSQHMSGRAADIKITGMSGFEIAKIALDVCNCEIGIGLAPGFAHIDVRGHFEVWRYAGDPEEMDELVSNIRDYQKTCSKRSGSSAKEFSSEAKNFIVRRSPISAAIDLFKRGYINYDALLAISNGERNIDALTDMVFNYRHPQKTGLSGIINVTDNDYRKLRKEWQQIRSRIIEPVFASDKDFLEAEISTGRGGLDNPFSRPEIKKTEHDDVPARIKWFNESRFGINPRPTREILVAYADSVEAIRKLKQESNEEFLHESLFEKAPLSSKNNWAPLGPSAIDNGQGSSSINLRVSGRITSIAAGPSGTRIYIGSANGGVWSSVDGGKNWSPLDDFADSPSYKTTLTTAERDALSVGAIAVRFGSKKDEDEIYVGTGEPVGGYHTVFGVGIKHSIKGGTKGTWKLEAKNLSGRGIYKIVIDPIDSKIVYAATTDGLYQRPSSGFETWKKISVGTSTGAITDFLITVSGTTRTYYAAVLNDGVYSTNDLKTWPSAITGIIKDGNGNPERMALAAGENNSSIVYAFHQFYNTSGPAVVFETRLYRLHAGSFKPVTGLPSVFNGGGQGNYNLILGVDPSDDDTVYIGGNYVDDGTGEYPLSLFKSKITSPTAGTFSFGFTNTANPFNDAKFIGTNIHADGHAIAFALDATGIKKDGNKVWIGSDGGVFFSDKAGLKGSFDAQNYGLAITQMTYLAQHPNMPSVIFAGCQDNGTLRYWGEQIWFETRKGDGGGVAVDPNNPYNIIRQYVRASLTSNVDGGISTTWNGINFPPVTSGAASQATAAKSESDSTRFYGPIAVSPEGVSPTMLAFGTYRLWLSLDWGLTWKTIPTNTNPYSATPLLALQDSIGRITSVKIVSGTRIFATTSSDVYRYELSGGTWRQVQLSNTGLPTSGYFITAIDGDPFDPDSCYISLGGSGNFVRCVYYDNATAKWYNVGPPAGILKIPCHAIATDPFNPGIIYLGSDVGVWKFVRNKKLLKWSYEHFSNGLPEVVITDLMLHKKGRLLRAATHGRGVWEIALDKKNSPSIDLYLRANYADDGRINIATNKRFDFINLADNPQTLIIDRMNLAGSPDIKIMQMPLGGYANVFVQINNRGYVAVPGKNIRIALLITNGGFGSALAVPINLAQNINSGNTKMDWLGTDWKFGDKITPYRNGPAFVNNRISSEVFFQVDLSDLDFTKGHFVSFVAIISSVDKTDQFKGTERDLDKLVMSDKHISYKTIYVS